MLNNVQEKPSEHCPPTPNPTGPGRISVSSTLCEDGTKSSEVGVFQLLQSFFLK